MRRGLLAFGAAVMFATGAAAAPSPGDLYQSGEFAQAEAAGIAQNDAKGLTVAARAALADDLMRDTPCLKCLRHAQDLARRAIDADPAPAESHVYLAVSIGFESRVIGDLAAASKGYPDAAKKELDIALAHEPDDPWAWAALGSWHIEIVRGAGPGLAHWLFGASFAAGQAAYARALALDPGNPVLRYQHALTLAGYDLTAHRHDVEEELTRAASGDSASAYENFVRDRARELLETLRRGDGVEAARLVRHDRGFPA
jgi:tetratricopeptide (TPR) repeat protein